MQNTRHFVRSAEFADVDIKMEFQNLCPLARYHCVCLVNQCGPSVQGVTKVLDSCLDIAVTCMAVSVQHVVHVCDGCDG